MQKKTDKKDKEIKEDELPVEDSEQEIPEQAEESESTETEEQRLTRELEEAGDKYLRLAAEYDNFRKRSQREREECYSNATGAVLEKLLPVWDNFERASQFPCNDAEFSKGFEMIKQSFEALFTAMGVEAVGEIGETFNPELHNAVMHIEDEELGENVISQVLQKGYKMGDKVLRYAMVQTAN